MTTVVAMQVLGLVMGPLAALGTLWAGVPPAWAWRLLLSWGTIPAALAFHLRRQMAETLRFTLPVQRGARPRSAGW
ncbi:MAG: hypothetical protein K6V97_05355 [Actinomycetia bacterium]|nr:hypothetical protein [Actinomycetes bacterium]